MNMNDFLKVENCSFFFFWLKMYVFYLVNMMVFSILGLGLIVYHV